MKKSILVLLISLVFFVGCAATFLPSNYGETEQAQPADNDDHDQMLKEKNRVNDIMLNRMQGDPEYLMDESEQPDKPDGLLATQGEPQKEPYRKENLEQGEEKEDLPKLISPPDGKPTINTEINP
jgi:hypothetical protein